MDLSKFNNLSQFIKNLMNSYNNTLIIKIGISDNYDTSYLFNNIIMKYGGNYVLCDTNREKIEEIKDLIGNNGNLYFEQPFKFIHHIKDIIKTTKIYQKLKLHIIIDFYDNDLTPIEIIIS